MGELRDAEGSFSPRELRAMKLWEGLSWLMLSRAGRSCGTQHNHRTINHRCHRPLSTSPSVLTISARDEKTGRYIQGRGRSRPHHDHQASRTLLSPYASKRLVTELASNNAAPRALEYAVAHVFPLPNHHLGTVIPPKTIFHKPMQLGPPLMPILHTSLEPLREIDGIPSPRC